MISVVRIVLLIALMLGLAATGALAQSEPKAAEVQAIRQMFQKERADAVAAKFPAEALVRADEFAGRAEKALKDENYKSAARHFRDARWQLPYLPPGLPDHVVRIFGEARLRHSDRVNRLAYNPGGTRLASCSRDGTVKIWDLGNGREIVTYRGHLDQPDDLTKPNINALKVTSIAFHPKKPLIASASGNQVHLWEPETGKFVKTLLNLGKTEKPIKPIAFSPDGKFLAVGADDGILRVVDVETGKVTYSSPSRNARIEALAYSPNGKMIVVGDNNSQIAVYAPGHAMGQLLMTVPGIELGEVQDVVFSADNGAVFACGKDPKVRLTAGPKPDGSPAANTATRLRDFVGHTGSVGALALTPDGKFLVTGGSDNTVRVWEVSSAKQLRGILAHQTKFRKPGITALAVRGDGRQIASATDEGDIRLWDLNTVDEHRAYTEATDSLWAAAYSPDGKRLASAGNDRTIRVYNTQTSKLETTLTGAKAPITSLAFFPDSNRLASAGGDQTVVVWDVESSTIVKTYTGHESAILSLAVSDDGKRIVSGSADRTVRAFSPESDKALWNWPARSAVCAVAIQKGNRFVAAGLADGTLVMLDISGSVPKEVFGQPAHVSGIACLAFTSNGQRLASVGGDGVLRVWTVGDDGALTQMNRFDGPSKAGNTGAAYALTGVAFTPDGRFVATVGADSTVRIWDVEGKTESRSLLGHTDWVTCVCFSPDGRSVASVGVEKDRALRVFELPPLDLSAVGGHHSEVNAAAISPSGKVVGTAGDDKTIRLWDIGSGKEFATLVGNADTPFALAFLGDDNLVMGGSLPTRDAGRLHFWGTKPERLLKSVPTGEVFTIVTNRDGKRLAAWVSTKVSGEKDTHHSYEIYDAAGNRQSVVLDQRIQNETTSYRNVKAVAFTPNLDLAVAGDDLGNVAIWDLTAKKQLGSDWPLFTNSFQDIGITPDKQYIVAADSKGVVSIAEVAKRNVVGSMTPHTGGVRTLLVAPTGASFVTVSNDREVKAWSLAPGALKEPKAIRTWVLPGGVNGVCYTPDGKQVVTANADGTAYLLELP